MVCFSFTLGKLAKSYLYDITGSGRVFSGSGIWPKYGAGFGKTHNILTGFGIWLLPGKRDSLKFGQGMRDFVACLSGIREIVKTQINVIAAKANQPGERKISIEGPFYILNLLAFAEISLFKCIIGKEKTGFGIAMKKCGMRDSSEKGAGMRVRDPPPPFQTLTSVQAEGLKIIIIIIINN